MADNFTTVDAASATITGAADDIGGVKFPRVKLIHGADGTNDGDVSTANPLPVVQTGTPGLPTGAATAAKQLADGHSVVLAAGTAEVGKLAAGTALIGKVGIDQATANANEVVVKSGTVTAVTSITNAVAVTNAGITSIDGKITACNTGAVVLAAGTAEIGKLAAGTALIGKVDLDKVAGASVAVSNGTADTSLRVTIASDSTGQVKLATGTAEIGNVKNSGTFAVQAAATVADGASVTLGAKADGKSTATDTTAVSAMSVLKEISYMEQNPASRAVTNAGTFAVQSVAVATTGYARAFLDHADTTTAREVVAATTGSKKLYITSIIISVAAAGSYWLEDGDAAQVTPKFTLAANGGVSWCCPVNTPYITNTADKALKIKGSAAGAVGVMITYYAV